MTFLAILIVVLLHQIDLNWDAIVTAMGLAACALAILGVLALPTMQRVQNATHTGKSARRR